MRTLLFTLLLLLAVPALGDSPQDLESRLSKRAKDWWARLEKADEDLRAGKWKAGLRKVEVALSSMCKQVVSGKGVVNLLGKASFLRAVAEAGLGKEQLASFDYVLAQRLVPAATNIDLGIYGEAATLLEPWRVKPSPEESESPGEDEDSAVDLSQITPPRKKSAPPPKFPFAKAETCQHGPIVVQAIIDEEGLLRWPTLKTPQDPLLTFAAMDAFRKWRFAPALKNGQPVEVYFNLTVNFAQPACLRPAPKTTSSH